MKIKGLIIGSLLTTLAIMAYAQPQLQAFSQNCSQNPDLFLTIKNGLPSNVAITQMQSSFQVNGTNSPINASNLGTITSNTAMLVGFANSTCLQQNNIFSVGIEIKSLTTNTQSTGGVPVTALLASAQPTPGVGVTTNTPNLPPSVGAQQNSQVTVVQLPTTTLPVNCTITVNQIQAGNIIKTITFDSTTQTYFCN